MIDDGLQWQVLAFQTGQTARDGKIVVARHSWEQALTPNADLDP